MSQQYYTESQWAGAGPSQPTWDHQTPPPPPARTGGSSSSLREVESVAFSYQFEEVDRAVDNLVKSGKMYGPPGRHGRVASGHGPRPHSLEFGDPRAGHPGPNLQNFYAAQRHQPSRGSNEAEQMMQAKRRMAAQRERELRNYHQEQQLHRNVLADMSYNGKSDRALSPGSMSEDDQRRDLINRQRTALFGEAGYPDESATNRQGVPSLPTGTSGHRGPSPLAYDYGRPNAPNGPEGASQPSDLQGLSRANSNASPQSNPPANIGIFDSAIGQQANRTSNSSPTGGSPPRAGGVTKPTQSGSTVAPIGTRPSAASQAQNPALNKRSTTPLPSPLSHGFSASGNGDDSNSQGVSTTGAPSNPPSAAAEGYNGWGNRSGVWGNKSSLGVQASVWG
ncbi:uncharacterized protein F4822DRAFT_425706 [Hypoxylon trugodes]|uniref:uncharacterized protein n=1 Tax=Hypoxylon trugodes TaxID=326681 RepID=UPI0021A0E8CE|nr:uncharacterized protein F4822DRAFT_425706 [Hypoxylon trugodes]KAI1392501.1 hypothetical protein F4822DRAFT_425706 [Hypoxylon trugodes]